MANTQKRKSSTDSLRQKIVCPACQRHFVVVQKQPVKYCPYCKALLQADEESSILAMTGQEGISLPSEQAPTKEQIQFTVGPYHILEVIGKGGMGEVFLAYDTTCGRKIALKRIRPDLITHKPLHQRFLKEARITSQLTHPAIIPIYTIQDEAGLVYYTMPYVEGKTLKEILTDARHREKHGLKQDHLSSIPALVRTYFSVCQAIAYAHSKGVIHRDIKPTNVIVGRYGEVLILDWGLAKLTTSPSTPQEDEEETEEQKVADNLQDITRIGRIVGTVAYLAPERALGHPASVQTDVYALGVVLYQILTLHHPFHRQTLRDFRENIDKEVLYDPAEVAPYRDVPPALSRVVLKCLTPSIEERYSTVDELIHDLESYLEGRSEWFPAAELDIQRPSDWEFQENILIAEHTAITRGMDVSDWVILMISQASFSGNTRIEARVRIGEKGHGLGFLLSIPESEAREYFTNGYCLWIGSDINKSTRLLRTTVEVMEAPDTFLQRNAWYQLRIEKIENNIYYYLNDVLQFSYISHLPLDGTHVGLMARDADFEVENFTVSVGSENITVNCLAVPDAFLAHKQYNTALSEYRRIAYAFPGTAEGREALFRAGVTLLEEARNAGDLGSRMEKSEEALDEFGKLRKTPGAPLEYLGKALIYEAFTDRDEEIKCFELAFRRYPQHPLLPVLQEQLIYRMHESSRTDRTATYQFILLAIRHLSPAAIGSNVRKLFNSLKKNWEPLPFFENPFSEPLQDIDLAIHLAFWLAKPYVIAEIIDELSNIEPLPLTMLENALYALIELGATELAAGKLVQVLGKVEPTQQYSLKLLQLALRSHYDLAQSTQEFVDIIPKILTIKEVRVASHLMQQGNKLGKTSHVSLLYEVLQSKKITPVEKQIVDEQLIWMYLVERRWEAAGTLLHTYPVDQLTQDTSLLHFLYGCWLYVTEGKEIAAIHFTSVLEMPYPRSWSLFSHFYEHTAKQERWLNRAFVWEKRQLFKQAALFYHCSGNIDRSDEYKQLEKREYSNDS